MIARFVTVALLTVAACGAVTAANAESASARQAHQNVYWTLFANPSYPQIQIAAVPLVKKAKVVTINSTQQNNLIETSGVTFDSAGHFWILSFGEVNGVPTSALMFDLPITRSSTPVITLVLNGTVSADGLAFDPSGNLWVTSPGNESVQEYTGPFTGSASLAPAITLTAGIN